MSGRRRTGGAVEVIGKVYEASVKRRDEQYKSDREFQQRLLEAGLKGEIAAGRFGLNVQTGQFETRTPPEFDPATLSPGQLYSQKVVGGTLTSRGPQAPSQPAPVDPYVQLQREAAVQNSLQEIEQRNALAPTMAMADREQAFPRPQAGFIGGYTDNPPNVLQKAFGARQRPQAAAVPYTDTTALRNRLTVLQGNALGTIAPPRAPVSPTGGGVGLEADPDLPDPADFNEGAVIEDEQTGQQYQLVAGTWQPL